MTSRIEASVSLNLETHITIWRTDKDGEKMVLNSNFGENDVEICQTNKEDPKATQNTRFFLKLVDPPDEEGITHYIHALPKGFGMMSLWAFQISKEEAETLKKLLDEAWEPFLV